MGKRRCGRKITGKDPKSTLPKISPFQKALEPGSQDDLRASARAKMIFLMMSMMMMDIHHHHQNHHGRRGVTGGREGAAKPGQPRSATPPIPTSTAIGTAILSPWPNIWDTWAMIGVQG